MDRTEPRFFTSFLRFGDFLKPIYIDKVHGTDSTFYYNIEYGLKRSIFVIINQLFMIFKPILTNKVHMVKILTLHVTLKHTLLIN